MMTAFIENVAVYYTLVIWIVCDNVVFTEDQPQSLLYIYTKSRNNPAELFDSFNVTDLDKTERTQYNRCGLILFFKIFPTHELIICGNHNVRVLYKT